VAVGVLVVVPGGHAPCLVTPDIQSRILLEVGMVPVCHGSVHVLVVGIVVVAGGACIDGIVGIVIPPADICCCSAF